MTFRSGMIFALAAVLTLGGCAAGATGGGGPQTSPIGRVYEPGTPPTQTAESRAATLAAATGQYEQALAEARQGIATDSTNPIHYFLAGEAAAGMEDYELADSMWTVAQRIYPTYELDIEPTREGIWADAFNAGVEAYNAGTTDEAVRLWTGAHTIYKLRPEAAQNLAVLLTQEGEYERAIEVYQEALDNLEIVPGTRVIEAEEQVERDAAEEFILENLAQLLLYTDQFAEAEAILRQQAEANPDNVEIQANLANAVARQGRQDEASAIYTRLLGNPSLSPTQLFNVGVSLFNAGEHARGAEAFERVTQMQPNSRDAWYNLANARYAGEMWTELAPISPELIRVDPLNENAALIVARAYRETDQNDDALAALQRIETLPVFVEELQLRPAGETTGVRGRVIGNAAAEGTPIQLRFTFYNDGSQVGTQTATVNAPAAEQSVPFEIEIPQAANAYRYELVQ